MRELDHRPHVVELFGHVIGQPIDSLSESVDPLVARVHTFGHELERDTREVVTANGGRVLGSARVPLNTADFSSFLLQARASRAKAIGLANSGADTISAIKQAVEFGLPRGGQRLVGLLVYINDVHGLGLQAAQGMLLTEGFYWDMNDETRAWSRRFFERTGKMPNMSQAGVYSSVMHYLKAVEAAGTDETAAVMRAMKSAPIKTSSRATAASGRTAGWCTTCTCSR